MWRRHLLAEDEIVAHYTGAYHRRQRIIRYAIWTVFGIVAILAVLASL